MPYEPCDSLPYKLIYKRESVAYEIVEAKYNLRTGSVYYYLKHPAVRMPDIQVSSMPLYRDIFGVSVDVVSGSSFFLVGQARAFFEEQFTKIGNAITKRIANIESLPELTKEI